MMIGRYFRAVKSQDVENGNLMLQGQLESELLIEGYESFPLIDVDPYKSG